MLGGKGVKFQINYSENKVIMDNMKAWFVFIIDYCLLM